MRSLYSIIYKRKGRYQFRSFPQPSILDEKETLLRRTRLKHSQIDFQCSVAPVPLRLSGKKIDKLYMTVMTNVDKKVFGWGGDCDQEFRGKTQREAGGRLRLLY